MKYALITTAVILLSFAVSWLVSNRIEAMKRRPLWVRAVFTAVLALLLQGITAAAYLSVYYKAEAGADAALADSEAVTVRSPDHMLFFDGPGTETALVFYPGAKVESKAYAPLMKRIAEAGTDCFLLDPPLHLSMLDASGIQRAYAAGNYKSWYAAGHSLGAVSTASYAAKHPEEITGVILLGGYPTASLKDTRLLLIYGSEDGILDRNAYEKSRTLWPLDAEEQVIQGGNHAGFGCYGIQNGDGTASISKDAQQEITAESIRSFVSKNSEK